MTGDVIRTRCSFDFHGWQKLLYTLLRAGDRKVKEPWIGLQRQSYSWWIGISSTHKDCDLFSLVETTWTSFWWEVLSSWWASVAHSWLKQLCLECTETLWITMCRSIGSRKSQYYHAVEVQTEFERGDCWLHQSLHDCISRYSTLFGVHGTRRTFYAYKDTVVIGRAKQRGNFAIIKRFRVI